MPANPDFRDLFAAFNAAQVRYLLVGGYALAFHGRPRFTKDLGAFGAPLHELRAGDLERPGLIFQIGVAPNRIDVLTAIDGLTFSDAWPDREETRYSNQPVPVLSRHHLIQNKRATGRPQDLLDADELAKL